MNKLKDLARAILGAAGWCILGGMLLAMEISPWWLGWGALVLSGSVIVTAVDRALTPQDKWLV